MSKIVCDICGTAYPDTAQECPICGCAKDDAAALLAGAAAAEEEVAAGEPDAVLFFTFMTDEEGNETLSLVEDEAELDMVFEEFKNRMGEVFDFED